MSISKGRRTPPQATTTIWREGHQWITSQDADGRTVVTFHNVPIQQIRQIADRLRDTVIPSDALMPFPGKPGVYIGVYLQNQPGGVA